MKFSKLLVLSVLSLFGLSAQAAIVDGVRQAPAPESTAFTTGSETDYYYLYNTSANMFFTQGNTWGTRACVGPYASAVKMYFAEPATPDGTYSIQNSVCIRNTTYSWKGASAEAAGHALYCDQSTSWGRPYWTIEYQEGNVFRLVNSAPYFADGEEDTGVQLYMGRDDAVAQDFGNAYAGFTDDSKRYPVSDQLTATAGHHVDWVLVTPAAYAAVADAWPVYEKSRELKAAIDEAKEKSINVADEEAVYLEEASTIEQMDAAIATIKDKIIKAAENTATPENPSDMTSAITNASYDSGTTGWSGTAPAIGYTAGEFYQKNYNMYQDVTGIPNGVYAVKVKGYFRPGSTQDAYAKWATGKDLNAYLYAKAGEDSVAVALVNIFEGSTDQKLGVGTEYGPDGSTNDGQSNYVPNNMQAGEAYFNAGRYQNIVFNAVDDGKLRIGLMKDDSNFSMNWTMFDQWELSYLGNSAAAYTYWINEMKKALPDYSEMGETLYTADYLTAYNAAVAAAAATNKAEAVAALKAINDADSALQSNIALWQELQSVIADAIAVVANDALDPDYTGDLGEWVEWDTEDILTKLILTNDSLANLIAQKKAEIDEAKKHPISETDATNLLTNPDFSQGETGWTGFREGHRVKYGDSPMPVTGGTSTNTCAEAFSTDKFDLYQVVENAPVGVYEISVQGFCRNGRGDAAWNNYQNQTYYSQPKKFPVYVYLNDAQTPFVNVFSEPQEEGYYKSVDSGSEVYVKDGVEFPDGMKSSAVAFSAGMYVQKAYGLVAKEGDAMRIGVKGTSAGLDGEDDNWVIFDNFKLTWKGFQADIIKPVLEEQIEKAETETIPLAMDKDLYARLVTAIADGKASITEGKGKVMFECLSALYEIDAKVNESKLVFNELENANKNLAKEIEVATEAGRTSALADAIGLNDEVTSGITNHTIAEADVNTMIASINSMISRLRMPDQAVIDAASDANPVDMTSIIQNPTYDEGVSGWAGTEAGWGGDLGALAELYNKNFDYYQEFSGLPAGTYELGVQAFYRSGYAENDYKTLDSLHTSHAFLYAAAIAGEDSVMNAKAIQRLATIMEDEAYAIEWVKTTTAPDMIEKSGDTPLYALVLTDTIDVASESYLYSYVPNTMGTANDQFLNGNFDNNKVVVKLAEGETLRIGLLKTTLVANDWTIFDNWTLTYFGKNSGKEATGDNVTAIRTLDGQGETVKVEFFTLDGRKAGAAQKGLIIMKQTLDNGSIIVKKIRK